MASKRVAATALDWSVLSTRIPAENKPAFNMLKAKVDKHLRAVNSLPAELPAIDFSVYRSRIAVAGMVDNFESKYKGLQIPYPSDQGKLAEIDAQASEQKTRYAQFVNESKGRIAASLAELAKWEAMMPVEEMNLEEALDAGLTDFAIDPEQPTFYPHNETWESYIDRLKNAEPDDHH
uniref:ATP synthase subunit d, mitochondrial n=1 Tax=Pseudodiaptomus poplesia TaxID=213370 RepID=A0A0U2IGG4_9MAXI|nr:mitochondrial ATP synthase subunit d [Pseudodiaptomus poplesia]